MAFRLPGLGKAIQPSEPPPPSTPKFRTNKSFGLGKQGLGFSRGVVWVMLGGSTIALVIGMVGRMDETIQIRGVIESSDGTEKVVSTLTKKIGTVFVKNGEYVEKGEVLMTLENTEEISQARDARAIVNLKERRLAALQLRNGSKPGKAETFGALSSDISNEANRLLQQDSLKVQTAQLEYVQSDLAVRQNQSALIAKTNELAMARNIYQRYSGLLANGAMTELQVLDQSNKVKQLEASVASTQVELRKAMSRASLQRLISSSAKDRVDMDSQRLEVATVEEKAQAFNRLSELRSRIELTVIRANVSGKVFNLSKNTGQLVSAGEELLQVVPDDKDIAKLTIPDMNVGFLTPGMPVQLRLDAYSYSDFGSLKGRLLEVGTNLLPPDRMSPRASYFPGKVKLQSQAIKISGKYIPLRAGMGVTALVKVGEKPIISMITRIFDNPNDKVSQF
jgi:HlyD family secretion protein